MKDFIRILALLMGLLLQPSLAVTSTLLLQGTSSNVLETEHQTSQNFWADEKSIETHPFFKDAGGDLFALKELNLRASDLWNAIADCRGTRNGEQIALAFTDLKSICPGQFALAQELNQNYVHFLLSSEFNAYVIKLDRSRTYGRVPLHPILQQFSFAYYIHVISAIQFEEGRYSLHSIFENLKLDLASLVENRKKANLEAERITAAYKASLKDPGVFSIWSSRKSIKAINEYLKLTNERQVEFEKSMARHRGYHGDNWKQTYGFLDKSHRFLTNNFILLVQNLIHQFPSFGCSGIGLFEDANLLGILVHRLTQKSWVSYAAEEEFRNMILNSCNSKTHVTLRDRWVESWRTPGSDPLPEAIEISKFLRQFIEPSTTEAK